MPIYAPQSSPPSRTKVDVAGIQMVSNKSQLGNLLVKFLENQMDDRKGAKTYIGNPPQDSL